MLNKIDIEVSRTPSDLRAFVMHQCANVAADITEYHNGIQKRGLYKVFIDEIIPLSCFAVLAYPDTYRIKPVLGNQGYDAIVYDENGIEIELVEITSPHNGKMAANDAQLLLEHGCVMRSGIPGDDFEDLIGYVLGTSRDKALKDYGNCSLVVYIEPMHPFAAFIDRYESQVVSLMREMSKIKFRAKRVFLLISQDRLEEVHSS